MTETEAIEFLRTRVGDEGYVLIGQCPDGTGSNKQRTMDALMVQCWPSRGLSMIAVEYKRTLSDFRREMKDPHKADRIARYCHGMILLAPKGIIPVGELPPSWGLWEIHKTEKMTKLYRTKPPQMLAEPEKPLTLSFMAAVLRRREGYDAEKPKLALRRQELEQGFSKRVQDEVQRRMRRRGDLEEKVRQFEEASGLSIQHGWSLDKLGEGLRQYLRDPDQFIERIKSQRQMLSRVDEAMAQVIGEDNGQD